MVENITLIKSETTKIVGVSVKILKNIMCAKKNCLWNPPPCSCENGIYLASIITNLVTTCDEIIEEETKTIATNFNSKKKDFYILPNLLLITIALLIAVSIYY